MPDVELRPQIYKDPRPKEYFERFHSLVRARGPEAKVYEVLRSLAVGYAVVAFRACAIGSANVPNGPVILAPNHASFMDHFFTGAFVRRRVQFMAKSQLFKGPAAWVFSHGGVFPVRRGYQDEEAFISAFTILNRGGAVVMYCEGGRSRTGQIGDQARPGIGRLALESGVPIVPVAILGSHQVRNWKRLRFPKVTVSYGKPFRLERIEHATRAQQQRAADVILERIRELHTALAEMKRHGRAPRSSQARPEER